MLAHLRTRLSTRAPTLTSRLAVVRHYATPPKPNAAEQHGAPPTAPPRPATSPTPAAQHGGPGLGNPVPAKSGNSSNTTVIGVVGGAWYMWDNPTPLQKAEMKQEIAWAGQAEAVGA